jgi:hypothetical protein
MAARNKTIAFPRLTVIAVGPAVGVDRAGRGSNCAKYERMAAECLHLARIVRDVESKAVLLKMAQSWLNLAERVRAKTAPEKV